MRETNRFFDPTGDFAGEVPRRVYARIDRIENSRLLFEAVDAEWFDGEMEGRHDFEFWMNASNRAPISVIEIEALIEIDARGRLVAIRMDVDGKPKPFGGFRDSPWVVLQLSGAGENARLYPNLFTEGRSVEIRDIDEIASEMRRNLDRSFSIARHVVDEATMRRRLASLESRTIEWVVVYDVGQGATNGLCDDRGMPLAYADLGGGVLANKGTFDPRMRGLCLTHSPPVILSHWDWDHWSSGMRFPRSQHMQWIVPLQGLGAVHSAFAAVLAGNGCLNVWPSSLDRLGVGQIMIRKCTGNGRNHSGLAVEVHGPDGQSPILLPGDARYNVIPGALGRDWQSVVVPHHGADMRNSQVPGPSRSALSRAAYSCGAGNNYSHPRDITERNHHVAGWPHSACGGRASVDLRTDRLRTNQKLGHIGLGWDSPASAVRLPCRGGCALDFEVA